MQSKAVVVSFYYNCWGFLEIYYKLSSHNIEKRREH